MSRKEIKELIDSALSSKKSSVTALRDALLEVARKVDLLPVEECSSCSGSGECTYCDGSGECSDCNGTGEFQ